MGSVLSSSPDSLHSTANTHDLAQHLAFRDHAAVLVAIRAQPQLLRAPLLPGANTLWHAIARSGDAQLLALLFQEVCAEHASDDLTTASTAATLTSPAVPNGAPRASPGGAPHGLTDPSAPPRQRTTALCPFAQGPRTPSPGSEDSRSRIPMAPMHSQQQRLSGEWQQADGRDSQLEAQAAAAAAAAAAAEAEGPAVPPHASSILPARCQHRLHQYASCPVSTDLSGAYALAGSELASSSSFASSPHALPPTSDGSHSPGSSPGTPRSAFRRARRPGFGPGSPTRDTVPAPRAPLQHQHQHQHHQHDHREFHAHGHEHHSAGYTALTWSPSTPLPSAEAGGEGPQAAAAHPGPLQHPTDRRHRLSRRQGHSETCIPDSGFPAAGGRPGNAPAAAVPSSRTRSSLPLSHTPAPSEHTQLAASAPSNAAFPQSSAGNQSFDPNSGQADLLPYSRSHSPRRNHTHSPRHPSQADPTAHLPNRPDCQGDEVHSSQHNSPLPPATLPSVPAPGPGHASDSGPPGSVSVQRSSSLPSRLRLRRGLVRVLQPLLGCGGAPHAEAAAADGAVGGANPLQDAGVVAMPGYMTAAAADGRTAGDREGGDNVRRRDGRRRRQQLHLQEQGGSRGGALDAAAVAKLLNVPNGRGQTPLMVACAHGSSAVVALLLRKGADPWACDPARRHTALHCAVLYGQYMAAKLLLGLATANHRNHRQRPAAADLSDDAADGNRPSASSGIDEDSMGPWGGNLDSSTSSTSPRTLLELLEARSSCGATALHYASDLGHVALVELLLRHGADPTAQVLPRPGLGLLPACWRPYGMSPAAAGSTALHLAARGGELHVALVVLRHHAARCSEHQSNQQEPHPQDALAPADPRSIRDAAGLLPHDHARLHRSYRLALLLRPDYPAHWLYDTPSAAIAQIEARASATVLVAAAAGQGDGGGVQTLAALAAAALARGLMQQLDAAEAAAAALPAPTDGSGAARRALYAQLELDGSSGSNSRSSSRNSLQGGDWDSTASGNAARQRSGRPRVQRSLRSSLLGPLAAGPGVLAEPHSPMHGDMAARVDGRGSNGSGGGGGGGSSDSLLSALARADTAAVAAIVEAAAAEGADGSHRSNVSNGGDGDGAGGEVLKPPPTPLAATVALQAVGRQPWQGVPTAQDRHPATAAAAATATAATGTRTHPGGNEATSHGASVASPFHSSPGPSLLRHPGAADTAAAAATRAAARAAAAAAAAAVTVTKAKPYQQLGPAGVQTPACADVAVTGRPSVDGNASVSASGSCGVCYEDGPLLLVAVRGCGHRLCCQCARRVVGPCLGQGHGSDGRQGQEEKAGLQPRCPFCRGGIDAFGAV